MTFSVLMIIKIKYLSSQKKKVEDAPYLAVSNIQSRLKSKSLCKNKQAHSSNLCTNLLSPLEVKLCVY